MGIISHLGQILYFKSKHIMYRRLKGCVFLCNLILCQCLLCVYEVLISEASLHSSSDIQSPPYFGERTGSNKSRLWFMCSDNTFTRNTFALQRPTLLTAVTVTGCSPSH